MTTRSDSCGPLRGHDLRNEHLRQRALRRAAEAPPLARLLVTIRAEVLGLTRLDFVRQSGLSRGTVRDLELGIHTPSRRVLQQILTFCESASVPREMLDELRRLYLGEDASLGSFLAQLELKAGGTRELARRAGISPATLWEYQRGNFPLPWELLERLCREVGEETTLAEPLWWTASLDRHRQRGYPEVLAQWAVLCERRGLTEKDLLRLGLPTRAVRQLRYLEIPLWAHIEKVAKEICSPEKLGQLRELWHRPPGREDHSKIPPPENFGTWIGQYRRESGTSRRELADLFGIGGKKPARILKCIEEDGFFSLQAYPAGLVELLITDPAEKTRLRELWTRRREQFHRRHRPETRVDLRLCREWFGFGTADLEPILGYGRIEYQRLERGVTPLLDTARQRIIDAIEKAGSKRVAELIRRREKGQQEQAAWQHPTSVAHFITTLAAREGGLIPLSRLLRDHGIKGLWVDRLRRIARGEDVPTWFLIRQVADAVGVDDLDEVDLDWADRYHKVLVPECPSPLGQELRMLIARTAPSLRAFSPRLGCNYSVLVRCFHKVDLDQAIRWSQVERILVALDLTRDGRRWRELHALWYTASDRVKRPIVR